ncbi:MAG: Octanoyltransferase LipM [candidate division BRC1 bacterium ADurb.BinA364]|nr:MAG: Octanoyltransferase LipM [candidate division BRC1 bacterium ADurb.BinA364]
MAEKGNRTRSEGDGRVGALDSSVRESALPVWRLLDTGAQTGARNMALDKALAAERGRGLSPNTLRFLQFQPRTALVGVYQDAEQEVRLEYCRQTGIDVNRRVTGGGALLFDESQLGWEIIAAKADFPMRPMSEAFHRLACQGCIAGLRELGIEAEFRPRNDIEVAGRKISGTGGMEEGEAFLFQGTLLVDFDVEAMIKALRIPTEKLTQASLESAADRVTWVARELGHALPIERIKAALVRGFEQTLGIRIEAGGMTSGEEQAFESLLPYFESDEWIYGQRRRPSRVSLVSGLRRTESAVLRANLSVDTERRRLRQTLLTGDFFVSPERAVYDLEARLKDFKLDKAAIAREIETFWDAARIEAAGFGAADVADAIAAALDKLELLDAGFSIEEANRVFAVNGSPLEILGLGPDRVLLPYCAMMSSCAYRREGDCVVCGMCSYGEAYGLAQSLRMKPVTILNFEHLLETLESFRADGIRAYIGSCCEAFYNKHYRDFAASGVPGLLVDVNDSTCYDLNKASKAYKGDFDGETELNIDLTLKLMSVAAQWKKNRKR